jgi:hypothetical protein
MFQTHRRMKPRPALKKQQPELVDGSLVGHFLVVFQYGFLEVI